ncbi:unnamed protein product [Kuraishia capsulata CBS 1993]|uniref:Uncharacterized protein n=1 Tax=Kuraishia capsulata CBS 1993 TaxID=1382522 RepID=W6MQ13_9ASCO|nr:uncharacterized protein KUCA_T00004799001 [Kuraishia capsulata CBS 1993]CDK28814.1 unnamed protein product [Kuraishia capsulata CBS 1993]
MQMAKTRKLRCFEVEKIIEIFLLRNIAIKLRILSHPALLGNGVSYNRTLVADKGLCCKEIGSHLYVEGKTHAGHERVNSSSENSIMENFVHITEIAIYFRTPTDTTTDRPKNKPTAGRLGTPKIVLQKPYNTRSSIKKSPGSKTVLPKIVSQSTTIDHKYIKRPLNSFMLYRAAMSRVYTLLCLVNCLTGFINENLGWKSPRIDWKQNADSATTIENGVLSYDLANELEFLREIETLVQKGDPKTLEKIRATLTLPKLNHHMCVHVIAMLWQTESESTKQEFSALAVLEKELHSKCYPNYKYNPRKREIDPVYWGKE